jgi:hypothetical protein
VNLAWKLAATLDARAHARLLDTYQEERMPFARRLLATTDRAFEMATSPRRLPRRLRTDLVPPLLGPLSHLAAVRRFLFRTVSQTAISYRGFQLNAGRAGGIHGGDRLPWVGTADKSSRRDNFDPLAELDWQLHVYGQASAGIQRLCQERGLRLHELPWQAAMTAVGLVRDAAYLVRPDGYIALVDRHANATTLARHLDAWALRFGAGAPHQPAAPEPRLDQV